MTSYDNTQRIATPMEDSLRTNPPKTVTRLYCCRAVSESTVLDEVWIRYTVLDDEDPMCGHVARCQGL